MALIKWFSHLLNEEGQPIPGADISIYLAGSSNVANIYTDHNGVNLITEAPQLVTNEDGYFEFWIGDSNDPNGYGSTQKFKIAWDKEGIAQGYNDWINMYPSYIGVDFNSNSTVRDKTVSNYLANLWEDHRTDDSHTVHGILEVNENSGDTVKNKLVSNGLAKGWEDHKNLNYNETPHGIEQANEENNDTVKNKLVSNYQLYELHQLISGTTFSETISASSMTPSGDGYFIEVEHSLEDEWPSVDLYNTDERKQISAWDIESIDDTSIRLWFNSAINIAVKVKS